MRWLFYTSGTTAAPKGAQHTDAGLLAASRTFDACTKLQAGDRMASLSPIAHVGGVLHVLSSLTTGSRNIITAVYDQRGRPPMETAASPWAARACRSSRATCVSSASDRTTGISLTSARSWSAARRDRPALHFDVKRELGGVGIVSGSGLTECPYVSWAQVDDPDERLPMAGAGPPPPGSRSPRRGGDLLPAGESGALRVRAPRLMLGYLDSRLTPRRSMTKGTRPATWR